MLHRLPGWDTLSHERAVRLSLLLSLSGCGEGLLSSPGALPPPFSLPFSDGMYYLQPEGPKGSLRVFLAGPPLCTPLRITSDWRIGKIGTLRGLLLSFLQLQAHTLTVSRSGTTGIYSPGPLKR